MQKTKQLTIGILVGGAIGSAAALLLAPKSGRETRSSIARIPGQLHDRAHQLAADSRSAIQKTSRITIHSIDDAENILKALTA